MTTPRTLFAAAQVRSFSRATLFARRRLVADHTPLTASSSSSLSFSSCAASSASVVPCRSSESRLTKRSSLSAYFPGLNSKQWRRTYVTSQDEVRDKANIGPFNWKAGVLFVITGIGLYVYFQNEKRKLEERKRQETASAKVGRPRIGGPFELTTQDGKPFTDKDLLGRFSLIYFGFTNCPDICPEELDKMSEVVAAIDKDYGNIITPVFVSCDPARDTVDQVKTYIQDFHPRLVGLTGTYDAVKAACKAYRVYFSTPPNAKPGDDYLVDHSIFFYLMDPNGQFVDAFGKSSSEKEVERKTRAYVDEWVKQGGSFRKD